MMSSATLAASDSDDAGSSSHGTLNPDALRKMRFRKAQPPGCRGPGEEGKGRWCEIMIDGGVTIRNVERLREVIRAGEKKAASGKLGDDSDELAELRRELIAGRAAVTALETATTKFAKGEKTRLAQKSTKSGPASGRKKREPEQFKCRKDLKDQDVEKLKYVCTVTEYKTKRESGGGGGGKEGGGGDGGMKEGKGSGGSGGGGSMAEMTNDERCKVLTRWMSQYRGDPTDEKTVFWKWLSTNHQSFESLEKLKEHSLNAGTGSGKVRTAIESKATKTYKSLSREIHPDKLGSFFRKTPKCDKQEMKDMLRTVFDRATDLKNCVLKPLRCDLKVLGGEGGDKSTGRRRDEF